MQERITFMELWLLVFLILILLTTGRTDVAGTGMSKCSFPAIFNFGDSNSNTAGGSAAFDVVPSTNRKPSGRSCDGRLIIDFIAEHLRLRYLSAYLDSIGADFRSGANFAVGGASIREGGYSPFHLGVQISQFQQFKARSIQRQQANLPKAEDFSKALYTLDIGQNDLAYGFQHTTEDQVNASIPNIIHQFSAALHMLYKEGARAFWIHNTGPIGCIPYNVIYYPYKSAGNLDTAGCVKPQNKVAQEFNRQLKLHLIHLATSLPHVVFTYVDVYSAKYALITGAKNQGFVDPMKFCCGSYYGYHADCGKKVTINGTVYGNPCSNPSQHISWDGIHYSQAANQWVFKHIINNSVSLEQACHKPLKI